jgi:potassium-transporting ATPase potassium-binding subunit
MEGKETRFGIAPRPLGAGDHRGLERLGQRMHDSYMPLSGLVMLLNMQVGEVIFGGVGAGSTGCSSTSCWRCSSPG